MVFIICDQGDRFLQKMASGGGAWAGPSALNQTLASLPVSGSSAAPFLDRAQRYHPQQIYQHLQFQQSFPPTLSGQGQFAAAHPGVYTGTQQFANQAYQQQRIQQAQNFSQYQAAGHFAAMSGFAQPTTYNTVATSGGVPLRSAVPAAGAAGLGSKPGSMSSKPKPVALAGVADFKIQAPGGYQPKKLYQAPRRPVGRPRAEKSAVEEKEEEAPCTAVLAAVRPFNIVQAMLSDSFRSERKARDIAAGHRSRTDDDDDEDGRIKCSATPLELQQGRPPMADEDMWENTHHVYFQPMARHHVKMLDQIQSSSADIAEQFSDELLPASEAVRAELAKQRGEAIAAAIRQKAIEAGTYGLRPDGTREPKRGRPPGRLARGGDRGGGRGAALAAIARRQARAAASNAEHDDDDSGSDTGDEEHEGGARDDHGDGQAGTNGGANAGGAAAREAARPTHHSAKPPGRKPGSKRGFALDNRSQEWWDMLSQLKDFMLEHGRYPKLGARKEVNEERLSQWMYRMRRAHEGAGAKSFPRERAQALEALPSWSWDRLDKNIQLDEGALLRLEAEIEDEDDDAAGMAGDERGAGAGSAGADIVTPSENLSEIPTPAVSGDATASVNNDDAVSISGSSASGHANGAATPAIASRADDPSSSASSSVADSATASANQHARKMKRLLSQLGDKAAVSRITADQAASIASVIKDTGIPGMESPERGARAYPGHARDRSASVSSRMSGASGSHHVHNGNGNGNNSRHGSPVPSAPASVAGSAARGRPRSGSNASSAGTGRSRSNSAVSARSASASGAASVAGDHADVDVQNAAVADNRDDNNGVRIGSAVMNALGIGGSRMSAPIDGSGGAGTADAASASPNDGPLLASDQQAAASGGDADGTDGLGPNIKIVSSRKDRQLIDIITESAVELGQTAAGNAAVLATLLERVEQEVSLQQLYAQLGASAGASQPSQAAPPSTHPTSKRATRAEADAASKHAADPERAYDDVPEMAIEIPANGSTHVEKRLVNAFWATNGPKCDLKLADRFTAQRHTGNTWRWAMEGDAHMLAENVAFMQDRDAKEAEYDAWLAQRCALPRRDPLPICEPESDARRALALEAAAIRKQPSEHRQRADVAMAVDDDAAAVPSVGLAQASSSAAPLPSSTPVPPVYDVRIPDLPSLASDAFAQTPLPALPPFQTFSTTPVRQGAGKGPSSNHRHHARGQTSAKRLHLSFGLDVHAAGGASSSWAGALGGAAASIFNPGGRRLGDAQRVSQASGATQSSEDSSAPSLADAEAERLRRLGNARHRPKIERYAASKPLMLTVDQPLCEWAFDAGQWASTPAALHHPQASSAAFLADFDAASSASAASSATPVNGGAQAHAGGRTPVISNLRALLGKPLLVTMSRPLAEVLLQELATADSDGHDADAADQHQPSKLSKASSAADVHDSHDGGEHDSDGGGGDDGDDNASEGSKETPAQRRGGSGKRRRPASTTSRNDRVKYERRYFAKLLTDAATKTSSYALHPCMVSYPGIEGLRITTGKPMVGEDLFDTPATASAAIPAASSGARLTPPSKSTAAADDDDGPPPLLPVTTPPAMVAAAAVARGLMRRALKRSQDEYWSGIADFCERLPVGSVVDARDATGAWCAAVIVETWSDAGVSRRYCRIHFSGWDSAESEWVSVADGRIVPYGVFTLKHAGEGTTATSASRSSEL